MSDIELFETHFSQNFCHTIDTAIKIEFPNIKGLDVSMDENGTCSIIFEDTAYTQTEVENFINKLKELQ
jgi:hypothetical protein